MTLTFATEAAAKAASKWLGGFLRGNKLHIDYYRCVVVFNRNGHAWGDIEACDPIDAARQIDHRIGAMAYSYVEMSHAPHDDSSGYYVYLFTGHDVENADATERTVNDLRDLVARCGFFVAYVRREEFA